MSDPNVTITLIGSKLASMGKEFIYRGQAGECYPEKGLISPAEFIPVAEETGLIIQLGEWALRTACYQNKKWQDEGLPPIRVAVNISSRQFQLQNLVGTVSRVLAETGLDPCWLELEITENLAMQNVEYTINTLKQFRKMGIEIAIDDFGTGYSSLNYLRLFPINTLKIDRSFIKNVTKNSDEAAIVSTIIFLAHNLNLKVVAEGVETEEQLNFLIQHQCSDIQGFLFRRSSYAAR
jgi:EAL domain-containing protein (putative c-di-GMP-specific phosphodiesterase class I)